MNGPYCTRYYRKGTSFAIKFQFPNLQTESVQREVKLPRRAGSALLQGDTVNQFMVGLWGFKRPGLYRGVTLGRGSAHPVSSVCWSSTLFCVVAG